MPQIATTTLGELMSAEARPRASLRDRRRRRVSQLVGRYADRSRPFVVSVHRARDPLQPYEDSVVLRREWAGRYLGQADTLLITYLPQGGNAGKIGLAVAGIALAVAAPYIAGPLLGLSGFAATALQAGLVIGGAALLAAGTRSKANKQNSDTRPVYGITGGGNLPRPGDRIPRLYGRCWTQPDLAQRDFTLYAGENQVLYKRMVVSAGKVSVKAIRAAQQIVWTAEDGFQAPFSSANVSFEVLNGTPSALVPGDVVSVEAVAGIELARPENNPSWSGPFNVNRTGPLVSHLVVSYAFPQGIGASYMKKGQQVTNAPGNWGVAFEYAPIDAGGSITGPFQTLLETNSTLYGLCYSSRPLRFSFGLNVPPGRYAVRGRNVMVDSSANPVAQGVDTATWDGLVGFVPDAAIRTNVTELTMRITSEKGLAGAGFGQIDVEAQAIIPVRIGNAWVEQETSKAVWAFCDVLRNGTYGGGLPDSRVDAATPAYYAGALSEFDTFDGVIRGPVSVAQAAATVLLPMRAEPTNLGRVWSLVRDEPKDVAAHVITRRQIASGSTRLGWDFEASAGAGHVIGEFDRDGDFRSPDRTPDVVYGPASLTPTRVQWQGVRTFEHAMHLTRWKGLTGFYRRRKGNFATEHDARLYARGDRVLVDAWFTAGAKVAGVAGRSFDTLLVDADIAVATGDHLILRDRCGREWGPVALAGQGATLRHLALSGASRAFVESSSGQTLGATLGTEGDGDVPVAYVGPIAKLTRRFIVRSVRPSGRDRNEVEALFDDPRVWDGLGIAIPLRPPVAAALADPTIVGIPSIRATSFQASASRYVQWTISPPRGGADLFRVQLSYDGANSWGTTISEALPDLSGTAELMPNAGATIDIRAQARAAASGLWGGWTYASFASGGAPILAFDPAITIAELEAAAQGKFSLDPAIVGSIGWAHQAGEDAIAAAAAAMQTGQDALGAAEALGLSLNGVIGALSAEPSTRAASGEVSLRALRDDVEMISATLAHAIGRLEDLNGRATEAGLEIGPDGTARLYSVAAIKSEFSKRFNDVSVTLSGLDAKISLIATTVFDGDLSGVAEAISSVGIELDAVKETLTSYVRTTDLTATNGRVTTVEQTLIGLDGAITDRATLADLEATNLRMQTAEQTISAQNGILQEVSAVNGTVTLDQDLDRSSLAGILQLLQGHIGFTAQEFANASTSLSANVDATGRAFAEYRVQLLALGRDTAARFADEVKIAADATSAVASRTQLLELEIGAARGTQSTLTARLGELVTLQTDAVTGRSALTIAKTAETSAASAQNEINAARGTGGTLSSKFTDVLASSTDQATGRSALTIAKTAETSAASAQNEINAARGTGGTLSSKFTDVIALATDQVTGQSAVSLAQTAKATANGISANGSLYFATVAGPTGYSAAYELRLTAGDHAVGLRAVVTNTGLGLIALSADNLSIEHPALNGGAPTKVLLVTGGKAYFTDDVRVDGSLITNVIRSNAISSDGFSPVTVLDLNNGTLSFFD